MNLEYVLSGLSLFLIPCIGLAYMVRNFED